MMQNLSKLNWKRVDVLLNHFLLVNWGQHHLGFCWPWNEIEHPSNRFDVLNHLIKNFVFE